MIFTPIIPNLDDIIENNYRKEYIFEAIEIDIDVSYKIKNGWFCRNIGKLDVPFSILEKADNASLACVEFEDDESNELHKYVWEHLHEIKYGK